MYDLQCLWWHVNMLHIKKHLFIMITLSLRGGKMVTFAITEQRFLSIGCIPLQALS